MESDIEEIQILEENLKDGADPHSEYPVPASVHEDMFNFTHSKVDLAK